MAQTVEQALQQAQLYTDEIQYRLIHLPTNGILAAAAVLAQIGEPFAALIVDKDEVTLIIPADLVAEVAHRLRDHELSAALYRLITFDLQLDPTLTGFMARIAAVLAAANVPILAYAAYQRDHLLVPSDHFDVAWTALKQLQNNG